MADQRGQGRDRGGSGPVLDVFWDLLERAADNSFSTTIRIGLRGWWGLEGGRPAVATVDVRKRGEEPNDPLPAVKLQEGRGSYPLIGLAPEHHYLITIRAGVRETSKLLIAPALPKPKRPSEEALEEERLQLDRAKVARELRQTQKEEDPKEPTPLEKEVAEAKLRADKAEADLKIRELTKKPTSWQRRIEEIKGKREMAEEERRLREVLPKLERKLEVVSSAVQPFGFQIVLRRVGKNGKAEPGPISAYDWDPNPKREQDVRWLLMTWQQEDGEEFVMLTRSLLPKSRKVMFFLPDDKGVKVIVDVPAKMTGGASERSNEKVKGLWDETLESFRQGRKKGG